jgi:carbonic anhydrase/acetyltransferase-like protein (isoleucine patch superfamily)
MQIRYLHHAPRLADPVTFGAHAIVAGRTRAGPGLVLGDFATVRADGEAIRLGANVFLGVRATVHIADSVYPAILGDDVSVGRFGLVHACTLGDGVVVGDAATVMDGAVVGAYALVMPGAIVPPRKTLAGGLVYAGSPAQPQRVLEPGELARWHAALRARHSPSPAPATDLPGDAPRLPDATPRFSRSAATFVAATARCGGAIELADDASIYFACVVDAGDARIALGRRSNVQDNSVLTASRARGDLVIGDDVTIGHNVRLGAARIGDRALVGMSAIVGDGVVVEDDACIGAGALVEAGTRVPSGWIYAGRPARPFRELKPAEREGFADIVTVYAGYSEAYRTG